MKPHAWTSAEQPFMVMETRHCKVCEVQQVRMSEWHTEKWGPWQFLPVGTDELPPFEATRDCDLMVAYQILTS